MNERIKLLAQQSKLAELYDRYVEQCMKNADDDILDYDVILKEFAESIVRECAQLARDTNLEDVEGGDSDVLRAAKQQILEHFGVEE